MKTNLENEKINLLDEFICLKKDFDNKKPGYYFSKGQKAMKSFWLSIIDSEEELKMFQKINLIEHNITMNAVKAFKIPEAHMPYIISRKNELTSFLNSDIFINYVKFFKDHNVEMFFYMDEYHTHRDDHGDIKLDYIDESKTGWHVIIDGIDYKY